MSPKNSLSPARQHALVVLENVLTKGRTLLEMIPLLENKCPDPRDYALARDIVYGTCRWLGRLHYVLRNLARQFEKIPPPVRRILELSTYQLLMQDRVPAYAVISDAVELTKMRQMHGLTGMVNAILRTISRDPQAFPLPQKEHGMHDYLTITESHPEWLVDEWLKLWDKTKVEALCRFNNTRAATSLRVRGPMDDAISFVEEHGIMYRVDERIPNRILLDSDERITPEFIEAGPWVVQDGAAMLAAMVTGAQPEQNIWDVCAAPGGKSFFFADQMKDQGRIFASDRNKDRMAFLREMQSLLKISCIKPLVFDVLAMEPPENYVPFDTVAVDAPCTGWGTFRRHPDLRWRLHPDDSRRLGDQAYKILDRVAPYVKNGGVLVYSTCTISPQENEDVVKNFLNSHPQFSLEPVTPFLPEPFQKAVTDDGWLSLFPSMWWDLDGAFAARLRKM